jgi:hypothetical protein
MNRFYAVLSAIMLLCVQEIYCPPLTPAQIRQAQMLRNTLRNSVVFMKIDPVKYRKLMVNAEKMLMQLDRLNTANPELNMASAVEMFKKDIVQVNEKYASLMAQTNIPTTKEEIIDKKEDITEKTSAEKGLAIGKLKILMEEIKKSDRLSLGEVRQYENNALELVKEMLSTMPDLKSDDNMKSTIKALYAEALEPQTQFKEGGFFGIGGESVDIKPWLERFNAKVDKLFSGEGLKPNPLAALSYKQFRDDFYTHIDTLSNKSQWDEDKHTVAPGWLRATTDFYKTNNEVKQEGGLIAVDGYIKRALRDYAESVGGVKPEDKEEFVRKTFNHIKKQKAI